MAAHGDQLGVAGVEEADQPGGKEHDDQISHERHDRGGGESEADGGADAVVLAGAVIVADDGLAALIDAEDRHEEEHGDAVEDPHDRNGEIPAESLQLVVDDDGIDAGDDVHGERSRADGGDFEHKRP